MSVWRLTWFFKTGEVGWTETLFSRFASVADIEAKALEWLPLRLAMMPNSVLITGARLSDDLVTRDSDFLISPGFPYPGTYVSVQGALPPEVAMGVRMETTAPSSTAVSLHRRIYPLRGLPKEASAGNAYNTGPTGTVHRAALSAFCVHMATSSNQWGIRTRDYTGFSNPYNITSITPQPPAGIRAPALVVSPDTISVPITGSFINFTGVRGIAPVATRAFQVLQRVTTGPPATFTIAGWGTRPAVATPVTGRFWNPVVQQIGFAIPDELASHRAGRPFGLQRGRRSPAR